MKIQKFDLQDLARFLVRAKKNAWAGDKGEIASERAGFKEHEFKEGNWHYRDSYTGYFCAPGQEIVRFQNRPVWVMSYDGGMFKSHWGNLKLAQKTFTFLKQALIKVDESMPFRGPRSFSDNELEYVNEFKGTIERFEGTETIGRRNGFAVFEQNYIGGLIIHK